MPATLTVASTQRSIHTRRSRLQRGAHGSATAEGTRSSGDSEDRSEATTGLVSSKDLLPHSDVSVALKDKTTNKSVIQIIASLRFVPRNLLLVPKKSKNLHYLKALAFAVRDLLYHQFGLTLHRPTGHQRAERSRTNPQHQPLPLLLSPRDQQYRGLLLIHLHSGHVQNRISSPQPPQ